MECNPSIVGAQPYYDHPEDVMVRTQPYYDSY